MSLDGIKVNHGALEVAVDDMRQMVARIDERINQLESELEPLKSSWAGNAQQAYHVAKSKWDQAIYEMRDLLNETHMAGHLLQRRLPRGRQPGRCPVRRLSPSTAATSAEGPAPIAGAGPSPRPVCPSRPAGGTAAWCPTIQRRLVKEER